MSNPFFQIQDGMADMIRKIPIIKNAIGESGAIPVHVWRGSDLTNELEAGLKQIGFGLIVKLDTLTQIDRDTWNLNLVIEMQLNNHFNQQEYGKGVSGWSVAWDVANVLHRFNPSGGTSPFYNIAVIPQPSEKRFVERHQIVAQIQLKTPRD